MVIILAATSIVFFNSCKKDKDDEVVPKPVISELEVGTRNSHLGVIGSDMLRLK
jgi:hypothetical protein